MELTRRLEQKFQPIADKLKPVERAISVLTGEPTHEQAEALAQQEIRLAAMRQNIRDLEYIRDQGDLRAVAKRVGEQGISKDGGDLD